MSRQRPYRDSTVERADLSDIGVALNSIRDRREIGIVIYLVIWGLSYKEAARRLGVSEADAYMLLSKALSKLRHPSSATSLRDEFDDASVTRSRALHRWANAAAQSMLVTCPCGRPFLPETMFLVTGGRPKLYCSNACRQAAYRKRKKVAMPKTV